MKRSRFSDEQITFALRQHEGGTAAAELCRQLAPNAQNLPEVLNILQSNPQSFKEYCGLIAEILPTIKWVSVRPHPNGGSQQEVLVWQTDPDLQRDDLAIPLNQCGTGVGQILSMIYVVKTSDQPKSIIIDEPGSFLHPSASRALICVFHVMGARDFTSWEPPISRDGSHRFHRGVATVFGG